MDPITNVREQVTLANEIVRMVDDYNFDIHGDKVSLFAANSNDLAERVVALDEWVRSGGFPPYTPSENLTRWTQKYLRELTEEDDTAEDVSDATIVREAKRLEALIFELASSFVSNDFDRS